MLMLGLAFVVGAQQFVATNKTATDEKSAAPVTEPKYVDTIYQVASDGNLVELEGQKPLRDVKAGLTGGSITYVYAGAASPVRITGKTLFVLRLAPDINPASVILALNELKIRKENRELFMVQMKSALKDLADTGKRPESLKLEFSSYGPNSVKVTVAEALKPGEYAIRTKFGTTFLFGVDAKE